MYMIKPLFLAIVCLCLSGGTGGDDDNESNETAVMFPNYLIINSPSKDPDKPWYISDYLRRAEQWELETTIDLNDLPPGFERE